MLFFCSCVAIVHLAYLGGDRLLNPTQGATLWVWGDSQTYRGLDLQVLEHYSQQVPISFAFDGSSVYDFVSFASRVPSGQRVLIPLPQGFLMRPPQSDWNRNAWSYRGLWALLQHGYSFQETRAVALQNLRPRRRVRHQHPLYTNVWKSQEISGDLKKLWQTQPPYLKNKVAIFHVGLARLQAKGCQIILLDYPVHPLFQKQIEAVDWIAVLDREQAKIVQAVSPQKLKLDSPDSDAFSNAMHLNQRGAQALSVALGKQLRDQTGNVLICSSERCQTRFK